MSSVLSRFLWWLMKPWMLIALLLAIAAPAAAQVSGPSFVFVAGTIINPDEVNTDFADIYDAALNRFGGTVEGHLLWSPDGTFDIGASGTSRPRDLFLQRDASIGGGITATALGLSGAATIGGTLGVTGAATLTSTLAVNSSAAAAIDVAGGITAGSGNVAIVDTSGKIPAISSTYFASLSGASLTGIVETAITDGALLARVGSAEVITAGWRWANNFAINGTNTGGSTVNLAFLDASNNITFGQATTGITADTRLSAGANLRLFTNSTNWLTINNAGALTHSGTLTVTGGALQWADGSNGLWAANSLSGNGLQMQIRAASGKGGWITFTEDGIADRYALGINGGLGALDVRMGTPAGTLVSRWEADGNFFHQFGVRFSRTRNVTTVDGEQTIALNSDDYMLRVSTSGAGNVADVVIGLSGGSAGREIVMCHVNTSTTVGELVLGINDASASAANRIIRYDGATPEAQISSIGNCYRFIYDATSSGWRYSY